MLRWVILRMVKKRELLIDIKIYAVIELCNQLFFFFFALPGTDWKEVFKCGRVKEIPFEFSEDFNYLKFDTYFYKTKMLYPSVGILVWPNWSESEIHE